MIKEYLRFSLINDLRKRVRLHRFQRMWRKTNSHNGTFPVNLFGDDLVSVGNASYGELHVVSFGSGSKVRIGNYCSIAQEVRFIINAGHRIDTISTFPFKVKSLGTVEEEATTSGDITIDDDVWIGYRAIIMDGVHVGQGAVIAAGAVVTKDVEPYTIVGGVPARPIRRRLEDVATEDLLQISYSDFSAENIRDCTDMLYAPVDQNNFAEIEKCFSRWN